MPRQTVGRHVLQVRRTAARRQGMSVGRFRAVGIVLLCFCNSSPFNRDLFGGGESSCRLLC